MSTFDDVMREIEATRRLLAEKKAGDARLAAVEAAVNRISAQLGRPGGFNSEADGRASATAWRLLRSRVLGNARVHLRNSCSASSANTPPVIVIGTNGALAAISALEIII